MGAMTRIYAPFELGVSGKARSTKERHPVPPMTIRHCRVELFDSVRFSGVVSVNRRRPRDDSKAPEVRHANDDAGSVSS
jgi:hypothetical protein